MKAEYESIDPGTRTPADVELLRSQWLAAPLRFRILMTIYLGISAWGGVIGGHLLTSAYSNWLTWSIALLLLEPVGVSSLAALIFLYWPNSWVGGILSKALGRAKVATLMIAAGVLGLFAWCVVYLGIEFWKLR